MEIKKDRAADLERGRSARFALSLLLVITLLIVALEFNTEDDGLNKPMESLDYMEDIELMPIMREDLVPMEIPKPQEAIPDRSEVVVGDATELLSDLINQEESDGEGDKSQTEEEQEEIKPQTTLLRPNPERLRIVEDLPQFPGGASELMKWLTKNLKYPSRAQKNGIEGKVVVQFIVNTDGSLSDIQIAQPADPLLNKEALRVMKLMPGWTPGISNDEPCRTMVSIPIVFKL